MLFGSKVGTRRETPAANGTGLAVGLLQSRLFPSRLHHRPRYGWGLPLTVLQLHREVYDYASAMATTQAVRRWIMTGAVAAVTITGTIYGAGLKGEQEIKQVRHGHFYTQSAEEACHIDGFL